LLPYFGTKITQETIYHFRIILNHFNSLVYQRTLWCSSLSIAAHKIFLHFVKQS